jgi:pimeloyl-ACP methyl ester carboxylesterase
MDQLTPFQVQVSPEQLEDLRWRLGHARLPAAAGGGIPDDGIDPTYLAELVDYWLNRFDWAECERTINRLPQFRARVGGVRIHFVHQPGRGPEPLPLVLTHGWPGSFLEMQKILPLLTDPAAHGGSASDAFDVVAPSLPGFGFSELPAAGSLNAFQIADRWQQLMSGLGYPRFGAQGGDFGASISTALGLRHPASLIGIHLNYIPGSLSPFLGTGTAPLTDAERRFQLEAAAWYERDGAYAHVQRTRPRTLACALDDSPVGLAAWIVEKFAEWGDCFGDVESRFSKDELLANVMLYWVTRTTYSASRLYVEMRRHPLAFGPDDFVGVPCGIARLPREAPFPPREWIERAYRVVHWSDLPAGGHFAAMEEPERLAQDIRAFFRPLRSADFRTPDPV